MDLPPAEGPPLPPDLPPPPPSEEFCFGCSRPLKPGAAFCGHCGRRAGVLEKPKETTTDRRRRTERKWGEIKSVLILFLLLLGSSAVMLIAVRVSGSAFVPALLLMAIDTVVIGVAALQNRSMLAPAYRGAGFGWAGYALVLFAAPVVLLAVHFYVRGLSGLFKLHEDKSLEMFQEHGLAAAVALGALWPAIFEEMGFRGVIFTRLRRNVRLGEAFVISSFAFAILHLSVPSLVTHLPMGLYFCWLRHRSGSLWPAMLAHFLHNSGVLLGEQYDWFSRSLG